MSGNVCESPYTHFSTTQAELPAEYYEAIGRALYRWTQLEAVACSLATSLLGIKWLEAVERLRGKTGFKVKNIFEQLLAASRKKGDDARLRRAIERSQRLYEKRKELFHSVWGVVSNETSAAVGIHEWSHISYDNFRAVSIKEIHEFATECEKAWRDIAKTAPPLLHGAAAIAVDDEDGLAHPVVEKTKTAPFGE